jgi:hypothetical protein
LGCAIETEKIIPGRNLPSGLSIVARTLIVCVVLSIRPSNPVTSASKI